VFSSQFRGNEQKRGEFAGISTDGEKKGGPLVFLQRRIKKFGVLFFIEEGKTGRIGVVLPHAHRTQQKTPQNTKQKQHSSESERGVEQLNAVVVEQNGSKVRNRVRGSPLAT